MSAGSGRFARAARLQTRQGIYSLHLAVASNPWSRFRGLMLTSAACLKSRNSATRGLLITRCASVHGFFMGYALDILFLAEPPRNAAAPGGPGDYQVTAVRHLKPWRLCWGSAHAGQRSRHALELPAGVIEEWAVAAGDHLMLSPP